MSKPDATDPYFMVRDEVCKSLDRAQALAANSRDKEALRTVLRSIEWDLEDLEETVNIVENSRSRFSTVTDSELHRRRAFILESKQLVRKLRQGTQDSAHSENPAFLLQRGEQALSQNSNSHSSTAAVFNQTQEQQQLLLHAQDERLDELGGSLAVLKHASKSIGSELNDQATLLESIGEEMNKTQNRLDVTSKKLARVLRMSSEKRQWCAIGVLLVMAIILLILLVVL